MATAISWTTIYSSFFFVDGDFGISVTQNTNWLPPSPILLVWPDRRPSNVLRCISVRRTIFESEMMKLGNVCYGNYIFETRRAPINWYRAEYLDSVPEHSESVIPQEMNEKKKKESETDYEVSDMNWLVLHHVSTMSQTHTSTSRI